MKVSWGPGRPWGRSARQALGLVVGRPGRHLGMNFATLPDLLFEAQRPTWLALKEANQTVARSFFRAYAGSGDVARSLIRFHRTPNRAKVARTVSPVAYSGVMPGSQLTSVAKGMVHTLVGTPCKGMTRPAGRASAATPSRRLPARCHALGKHPLSADRRSTPPQRSCSRFPKLRPITQSANNLAHERSPLLLYNYWSHPSTRYRLLIWQFSGAMITYTDTFPNVSHLEHTMMEVRERTVIKGARYFLAHTGLVHHGSKPPREIPKHPDLLPRLQAHLRSYEQALAYPPNQAFLGLLHPDDLMQIPHPWWGHSGPAVPRCKMPYGEIMPEEEFYGLPKTMDRFDLIWLEENFLAQARSHLSNHRYVAAGDLERLQSGHSLEQIVARCGARMALPLGLRDGRLVGCCNRAHEEDTSLSGDVLLENLACIATATMANRTLVDQLSVDPGKIDYVLGSGEEAIGDRYQCGGGNLAKAVAECCGLLEATGSDVKAFCCGPNHALMIGAGLARAGVFRESIIVGGCSLAKRGMKAQGHLSHDMPVLEDALAGFAVHVGPDDGVNPIVRLDALGRHRVRAQSSQQAILEALVAEPLRQLGLRFVDVDRYATELHNPEMAEPAGSGNVPLTNYKMIAALAVRHGEITPSQMPQFIPTHGMPGFSPTQGHGASANALPGTCH